METTMVLDKPAIEDTLFGEEQMTVIENSEVSMASCFCVCGCRDTLSRVSARAMQLSATEIAK